MKILECFVGRHGVISNLKLVAVDYIVIVNVPFAEKLGERDLLRGS